jgi:hypothetical protein
VTPEPRRTYDDDQRRIRACHGKVRFPSKKNASARARVIGGTLRARCPRCRRWHIGHAWSMH